MSVFEHKTEVDVHDVDYNGIAKASSMMKYIQTAAQYQLTENGMTYENLYSRRRAFLLSRIRIEFDEPVRAYERLTASSFPCESRGYSFIRCYKIERDSAPICRAVSVWALIDTETRALVKVNDFDLGLSLHAPLPMSINHFRIPKELREVGKFHVTYGICDQNRHFNNTNYPDMYAAFLPLEGKRIKAMTVNYANEAQIGEILSVERAFFDGLYYFRTIRSDGKINSEAEIELTDI